MTITGNNTYTGVTTAHEQVRFSATHIAVNAPGPFGNSDTPIVLQPGTISIGRLWTINENPEATVFDRDLIVRGDGTTSAVFGSATGIGSFIMNGNISLERELLLSAGGLNPAVPGQMIVNGVISGTGRLCGTDNAPAAVNILNANNTFTGGVDISAGAFFAGNDRAFGTGTIWISGSGSPQFGGSHIGAYGAARSIANPMYILADFSIGTFSGGGQPITFTGPVSLGGGNPASDGGAWTINTPAGTQVTFSGEIRDGGIVKAGPGKMILSGANIYTGGTRVDGGTLSVNNTSGSGTGSNTVTVSDTGVLAGIGTIAGPVVVLPGGSLAPGNSPGTLTMGALALTSTANLLFDLDNPNIAGSGVNDLVAVNGNLILDGVLNISQLGDFGPGQYTLFTYSGLLTDSTLTVSPLSGGFVGSIDTSTPGFVYLNVVPEPTAVGLLLGAATVVGTHRRHRRRSRAA